MNIKHLTLHCILSYDGDQKKPLVPRESIQKRMKSPKDLHKEASAAAQKAAEACSLKTPSKVGFAFVKFEGLSTYSFWAKKQGLVIKSKKDYIMMIKQYDNSMAKKVAYTLAYAEFMNQNGVKTRAKIDYEKPVS